MKFYKTAERYALTDISNYIQSLPQNGLITAYGRERDVWIVFPDQLTTKENRRLNRELKLNTINHLGNTRGFKN